MPDVAPVPAINAEALVNQILRDKDIGDIAEKVYSSKPNDPEYPIILTRRIGGNPKKRRLDKPMIQVDVYGRTQTEAVDIASIAHAAIHEYEGTHFYTADGWVVQGLLSDVANITGPFRLPDPDLPKLDRYVFTVQLTVTPLA